MTFPESSVDYYINEYDDLASHKSTLHYSLSTDGAQGMLRCTARLDDETYGSFEAKAERRIHSYGTCVDKLSDYKHEIWYLQIPVIHECICLLSNPIPSIITILQLAHAEQRFMIYIVVPNIMQFDTVVDCYFISGPVMVSHHSI